MVVATMTTKVLEEAALDVATDSDSFVLRQYFPLIHPSQSHDLSHASQYTG